MLLTTLEAGCDITGVTAVSALGIAVGCERLTTPNTGKGIDCFFVDLLWMSIPPLLAAFSGAELCHFPAECLLQWLSAVQAELLRGFHTVVILRHHA